MLGSWNNWQVLLERLKPSNHIPYHELPWSVVEESGVPQEAIENLPPEMTKVICRNDATILLVDKEALEKWIQETIPQPEVRVDWYSNYTKGMGRG